MEKKYIIVSKKDGKPIDNKQYTKEEFKKKAYELMEQTGLDRDAMNDTFTYQEVAEGGVSTEENTSGSPKATNDEFSSEDTSDKYEFDKKNDTYQATVTDDNEGWNKVLDDLDQIPPEIASLVKEHKDNIAISKDQTGGNIAMKKNAIRVLYVYNEFLKFYNTYCANNGELPAQLAAYLRTGKPVLGLSFFRPEFAYDVIKKDMKSIVEDMFKAINAYYKSDDPDSEISEFYDEVNDFDDELENANVALMCFKENNNFNKQLTSRAKQAYARMLAETSTDFNNFCKGKPTGDALSEYLMDIAQNKYHLTKIKLNYKDKDSKLNGLNDWVNPEDKESKNVRLSENLDDYLDLKHAKILDTDEDKKKLKEITDAFEKGDMTQKDAQGAINRLVIAARDKMVESLRLFFKFVGITKTDKMNLFTSGLKRLDEPDYQNNWRSLVKHYKESIEKKIEIFKNAHSNDMTKESLDECVNILDGLLKNADVLLEDVEEKNGTQLMAHSREISERIKEVQEKTAAAQKAFPKQ